MATENTMSIWDSAEELDGLNIADKTTLLGLPFVITGVSFRETNQGVRMVEVDVVTLESDEYTFTDSSTGVKAQLEAYLKTKGLDAGIDTGELIPLALKAPEGLRVSEYEVPERGPNGQEIRGRMRKARTFYLTTSGKRAGAVEARRTAKRTPAAK